MNYHVITERSAKSNHLPRPKKSAMNLIEEEAVQRQRYSEGDAKGDKTTQLKLYSEMLKDSIEMAVVDRSDPDGNITRQPGDMWQMPLLTSF